MSAGVAMCLTSVLWLVALSTFPASVVGRLGPGKGGVPSREPISYLERTPDVSNSGTAEAESQSIETLMHLRIALPEVVDSILDFNFHRTAGESDGLRRKLVGSSPPTCRSKCGNCAPCRPVHVAIGSPHGVISETEYYPEVWRCQCGNRYYMP